MVSPVFGARLWLLVAAVLIVAVVFAPQLAVAQPARTPHENPAQAVEAIEGATVLLFYSLVFGQASERRYDESTRMLGQLKDANISGELRATLDRYTALSRRLIDSLNRAESLLDEAASLVAQNRIDTARERLGEARTVLVVCQRTIVEIGLATEMLVDRIRLMERLARSRLQQTHQRLTAVLARLQRLLDELSRIRQELADDPRPGNPRVSAVRGTSRFQYQTRLEVSAPKDARPGMPVTVSGTVSSTGAPIDRTVSLLLNGSPVAGETTRDRFRFEITVPPGIPEGMHALEVFAAPVERYAAASWRSDISITRIPMRVDIVSPLLSILPDVAVTGRVSALGEPVSRARVTASFNMSTAVTTAAADGSFAVRMAVPFNPVLFGPQQIVIRAEAEEPYRRAGSANKTVFLVNPASTGLILVAMSLGALMLARRRTKPGLRDTSVTAGETVPESQGATPPETRLTAPQTAVLSAYSAAVRVVAAAVGVSPAPADTLSEYARTVAARVPSAGKAFAELTGIAETELYSGRETDSRTAARAVSLARQLEESCRGTA